MTASELIRLIPSSILEDLASETKVDYQVKKLTGEVTFKLILFSMLDSNKLSLRVMEKFLTSARFRSFAQTNASLNCKYNSIRDRICTINSDYFEQLFNRIFAIYNKELQEEEALSKVDSTFVSLAAKLLSNGMRNSSVDIDKRFIKYTVSLKGSIPAAIKNFTEQSYISEYKALTELINATKSLSSNVVVFDRGIQSCSSFDKFTTDGKYFITRSKLDIRCKTIQGNNISTKPPNSSITLISDEVGFLSSGSHRKTQYQYRVIKATIDKTNEAICFVELEMHPRTGKQYAW